MRQNNYRASSWPPTEPSTHTWLQHLQHLRSARLVSSWFCCFGTFAFLFTFDFTHNFRGKVHSRRDKRRSSERRSSEITFKTDTHTQRHIDTPTYTNAAKALARRQRVLCFCCLLRVARCPLPLLLFHSFIKLCGAVNNFYSRSKICI